MTPEELAMNDGRDGRPAYVAVNGTVYDVTDSPRWENGLHPPDHEAGQDLTDELRSAPHVRAVVERFPVVGRLEERATSQPSGNNLKLVIGIVVVLVIGGLIVIFGL
ncbi:MAG: cytochrome B5 [Deltaproteobacteria bacterium]|jgi:predicted heme/steroid binding protein|nr:cytochrome B5 [Deltaproteobacteria bacterium]